MALFRVVFLSFVALSYQTDCYYPNGEKTPQDEPCFNSGGQSSCCGQNYACLNNNMCMYLGDPSDVAGRELYARGTCTDKSWKSGNCPGFCNDSKLDTQDNGEDMVRCPNSDRSYFCKRSNGPKVDCKAGTNVVTFPEKPFVVHVVGQPYTTISSASPPPKPTSAQAPPPPPKPISSQTSEPASPTQASAATSNTPGSSSSTSPSSASSASSARTGSISSTDVNASTPAASGALSTSSPTTSSVPVTSPQDIDSQTGLSSGAKIGLGVGLGVGGLALIGGIVVGFIMYRRRRRPQHDEGSQEACEEVSNEVSSEGSNEGAYLQQPTSPIESDSGPVSELP